jgi:CheY-like chemotaxis protein
MGKKKILLVDDSETYRNLARHMLESRGYEVVALRSPFAFGAALTRERPDLALVDAFMPALQGDQLVRLARQNNFWDCPIVLHSDRSTRELSQMVEASGATGFILKTRDADKLASAIEGFLKAALAVADSARPISVSLDPHGAVRHPSSPPQSHGRPLESYRPPPESYRPPMESRSPPESRRPPAPESRPPALETLRPPPPGPGRPGGS